MKVNITPNQKKDWLIIFFVLDTTDLALYLNDIYAELEKTKLRKTTSIYVLKDTIQRIHHPEKFVQFGLEIYGFEYDEACKKTKRINVDIAEVDKKDGNAWKESIIQLYKITNATFNTLITWSHGMAIAIANINPPSKNNFQILRNDRISLTNPGCDVIQADIFENAVVVATDDSACAQIDTLFVSEIANSLQAIVRQNKFDMIIMCNCYMNTLDNCYNLKDITNYYVASATMIKLKGFDFKSLVKQLNNPLNLGDLVSPGKFFPGFLGWLHYKKLIRVKGPLYNIYMRSIIKNLLTGYEKNNTDTKENATIVASNLNQASEIMVLLNNLANYMIRNKDIVYPALIRLINNRKVLINEYFLINILDLLKQLSLELNCNEFEKYRIEHENFLLKLMLTDKIIMLESGPQASQILNKKGNLYSLYLPLTTRRIKNVFECEYWRTNIRNSSFSKETSWDNLVRDFVEWQRLNLSITKKE
ncbi:MAG TPA: clostripain-related cysteine peptidase [Ferruginibacter sp.]|nr:clostripain-related cysteine peptidase [Ferruginibacter sp.]